MLHIRSKVLGLLSLILMAMACTSSPTSISKAAQQSSEKSTLFTQASLKDIWRALDIMFKEQNIILEIRDEKQGIFSSKMILGLERPLQKFRLSGTLRTTPQGQKISIYRSIKELGIEKEWLSVLSDGVYEKDFLDRLSSLLTTQM